MYWLRLPLLGNSTYEETEERPKAEIEETSVSNVLGNLHLLSEILRHLNNRSVCQAQVSASNISNWNSRSVLPRHQTQPVLIQAVCKSWKLVVESSQVRHIVCGCRLVPCRRTVLRPGCFAVSPRLFLQQLGTREMSRRAPQTCILSGALSDCILAANHQDHTVIMSSACDSSVCNVMMHSLVDS